MFSIFCYFEEYYCVLFIVFFFFKQKTAYEMRISDWSSDVCSSDLHMARRIRLVGGDRALADLPGGDREMRREIDRLVERCRIEAQHGADARRHGRPEVRHMVDAVVVERDALYQVDLDLVGGDDAAQQVGPGKVLLLGDGDQRADGVARMARVLGEEAVVEVQLADRGGVGIGRPGADRKSVV